MKKILILTELGEGIGFGHYQRCLNLFKNFELNFFEVKMYVYCKNVIKNFDSKKIKSFDWIEDFEKINPSSIDEVLIIDSYLISEKNLKFILKKFKKSIIIDDFERLKYDNTTIINPNFYFRKELYTKSKNIKLYGGPDFVILNSKINLLNTKSFRKKILITVGGSDYRNINQRLIRLTNIFQDYKFILISNDFELKTERKNLSIIDFISQVELTELLKSIDIIICGCGQTLNESFALGIPAIAICIDRDQLLNQNFFLEEKIINKKLSWSSKNLVSEIEKEILFIKKTNHRKKVYEKSRKLTNKNFIRNFIKII